MEGTRTRDRDARSENDRFVGPSPKCNVIVYGNSPQLTTFITEMTHLISYYGQEKLKELIENSRTQEEEMAKEWSQVDLKEHWEYVINNVPSGIDEEGRDKGHEGFRLEDFQQHPIALQAGLSRAHIIALRLYTGPGYVPLNNYLRNLPGGETLGKVKGCVITEMLQTGHHVFPTTSLSLDQAIIKLIPLNKPNQLFRGISGTPDEAFLEYMDNKPRPFNPSERIVIHRPLEKAFLSTSSERSGAFKGNMLLVLQTSDGIVSDERGKSLRNGAQVHWISQYPGESEVLFPSFTILQRCANPQKLFNEIGEEIPAYYLEPIVAMR